MSTLILKKKAEIDEALKLASFLGFRFVSRKGRYILQAKINVGYQSVLQREEDLTWVDIPLLPEIYE